MTSGVFHLPRNSGNSGWDVNGTHVFGSFQWKISEINGTSEKVVLFSRWKLSDGKCVFHLRVSQVFTSSRSFTATSLVRWRLLLRSPRIVLYECPVCHGLAPDLHTLMNHNCVMYTNGKQNLLKKTLNFARGFFE